MDDIKGHATDVLAKLNFFINAWRWYWNSRKFTAVSLFCPISPYMRIVLVGNRYLCRGSKIVVFCDHWPMSGCMLKLVEMTTSVFWRRTWKSDAMGLCLLKGSQGLLILDLWLFRFMCVNGNYKYLSLVKQCRKFIYLRVRHNVFDGIWIPPTRTWPHKELADYHWKMSNNIMYFSNLNDHREK